MVIITNLDGKSLPLIDIDFLSRTRGTNGDYQIKMVVRRTVKNAEAFKLIEEESIITLSDNNKFKIKDAEIETVNDVTKVELEAQHTFYDNVDNYVYDIIPGEKVLSLHQALTHALQDTDITFYIEDEFEKYSFENFGDDNSIALFNKAKENFEFEFNIENNTHLRIYKQLGSKDKGIQIRWKQNIKTIKQSINTHNLATYIKGYGKPKEDEEGNVIEGEYVVEMDYTSPKADKYGIRHATPYSNEKITDRATMLRYLKKNLIDYPEMEFEITYENLKNHVNINLEDAELGDTIYLIHEPMNLNFNVRILEITDYPLHPHLKPIYTISSQPLDKMDKQTANAIDKANNDKEISTIKNKQTAAEKRIEKTIEAVADVENAMIDVEKEMDRIENEVIPAVEQAVDSAKIPTSTEPPYPIPTSNLWWDSSHNPPRLKRWTGAEWVVLAPTEDDIDALMQQMRDEAIQEGKTYTDEEINATRNAIKNKINDEIEAIEENYVDKQTYNNKIGQLDVSINDITGRVESTEVDFNDFKTGDYNLFKQQYGEFKLEMDNFTTKVGELSDIDGTLVDSFSQVRQEVGLIESTVRDVRVDVNGLEDSMTAVQTTITQLPTQINLAVTEGISALEIGGRNLIQDNYLEVRNSTVDRSKFVTEGYLTIQASASAYVGVNWTIPSIKPNTYYTLSYSYRKISGTLVSFGGHTDPTYSNNRVYLDGKDTGKSYSSTTSAFIRDDSNWHDVVVVVRTGSTVSTSDTIQIQPNRGNTQTVKVEIRDLVMVEGNKKADWSPAPEDQVNKTNVLSSINLSTEGVKIEGAKIDIAGLVTVLNADGTPGTMIDGGKLINKSVTTTELNVDQIFGNSAVITKIQSDIVRTSELDAGKITSGTINAARIGAGSITAEKIATGAITTQKISADGLNANVIKTGTLDASDVLIHGGSTTEYAKIDGAEIETRGKYTRTWFGETKTHDVGIQLRYGRLRFHNYENQRNLYFSETGISTYISGSNEDDDGNAGSGVIEFFSHMYNDTIRGLTMYSNRGHVALKAATRDVILDANRNVHIYSNSGGTIIEPHRDLRSGRNSFYFGVKSADSAADTDGYITYGSLDRSSMASGIRFKKSRSGEPLVWATDGSGSPATGSFYGKRLYGELYPRGTYNYLIGERTRIMHSSAKNAYGGLQARNIQARSIRINLDDSSTRNNFYVGVSTGELRVVTNQSIVDGMTTSVLSYRPVRASSFPTSSSILTKSNIKRLEINEAIYLLKHADIYKYHLDNNLEARIYDKPKIGMLSETVPPQLRDEDGVDPYSIVSTLWKVVQHQQEKMEKMEEEIRELQEVI